MNKNTNKTNNAIANKKLCFFHEVYDGMYDCNYCDENHECLSCECCYAFFEYTNSNNELREKLTRVVNNFMEEWEKRYGDSQIEHERYCVRDDIMDMLLSIVKVKNNNSFYYMENRLLILNFDELNELLHMFYELNYDGIETVWHRVNELYFAKCDYYDGPDPCELENSASWRFGSREDYMEAELENQI